MIDARIVPFAAPQAALARIADRRFGIGCDQLIVLEASEKALARMRIYNPDGGEVGACGNATRCIGRLLAEEAGTLTASIETRAGLLYATVSGAEVAVDMGLPRLGWSEIPLAGADGDTARVPFDPGLIDPALPDRLSAVNMGNPHAIFFVEDAGAVDLARVGPRIETHPLFPEKTNVSFAEQIGPSAFRVRVWERAAGATLACGTAACAVAVAAARLGLAHGTIRIELPGGALSIARDPRGHVVMTGPAETSFTGVIEPALLAVAEAGA